MKNRLKYLLPATLVAGFLCSLIYTILHYQVRFDDCFFDGLTHRNGILKTYEICFTLVNGRWFGNALACVLFYIAGHDFLIYAIFLSLFVLGFILSAAFLFRQYFKTFRREHLTRTQSLFFGLTFTSVLYFTMYPWRHEVWGWLDSATVHLLSVTLCMLLLALLLQEDNSKQRLLILLLSVSLGGLNEVNAISMALLITGLYLSRNAYKPARMSRLSFVLSVLGITGSLLFNYFSPGFSTRLNGMPDFNFLQALRNTIHSFLLPFMEPEPVSLLIIILLFSLVIVAMRTPMGKLFLSNPQIKKALVFSCGLIFFSVSLHCYTLSDIIPARGALWAYTLLLFTAGVFVTKTLFTFYRSAP